MSDSLADSIRNIPPVTRFFTISTVLVCFADATKIIALNSLLCTPNVFISYYQDIEFNVFDSPGWLTTISSYSTLLLQSHRFITTFLVPRGILAFPPQPLSAIMDIYFFYTFANNLESHDGKFHRNFPDCLWFTVLCGTIILFLTFGYIHFIDPGHFPIQHEMMLSCVTYIWSRSLKNSTINFLGIVPIKAYYLPLFNLFIKLLVDGRGALIDLFIGILGGYFYQCLQSSTLPFYNLFSNAYPSSRINNASARSANSGGNKVGFNSLPGLDPTHVSQNNGAESINDTVFDLGYLKAPLWLYEFLDYPVNTSKRTTAFYSAPRVEERGRSNVTFAVDSKGNWKPQQKQPENSATASGYSWFGIQQAAFKGKGHKLSD